jgi:hypothetical protein
VERGEYGLRWLGRLADHIRQAAGEDGVGVAGITRDLLLLNLTHQMGVRSYFQYRLFDPKLSPSQKREYLPDTKWARNRLFARLNPAQYRLPFRSKLVFNRIFGGQGLPVARAYAVYDPKVGYTFNGEPLRDAADLRRWLRQHGPEGFVFKPIRGMEGFQILVFAGAAADDPEVFVTLAGERYDADRLVEFAQNTGELEKMGAAEPYSYLLEERIRPHPALAELIGPTLCCVRIVTVVGLTGTASILGAVYKLQSGSLGVDHLSYGAVGSWVDLATGTLGPGRSRHNLGYTSVIPGTDRTFVGFELPHWAELKQVALRAAAVFPWARAIGWDIAISDRGPILIEGNVEWSTSLLQIPAPHGLMTGQFKTLFDTLATERGRPQRLGGRGTMP